MSAHPDPSGRAPDVRIGRRRRARSGIAAAVLVAAAVAGCAATPEPTPPDRYALDQVATRYRALGAGLVDGALRCAGLPAGAGGTERVLCEGGGWSLELVTHDSVDALLRTREQALAPGPDSARAVSTTTADAAFGLDQAATGSARIHWDARVPRPVSATLSTDALVLAELVAVYDARRFGALRRPEPPGPAFTSPVLWRFAAALVTGGAATCAVRPEPERTEALTEMVDCDFPNGAEAAFGLFRSAADLQQLRADLSGGGESVPGTHRVDDWSPTGRLIEYVLRGEPTRFLYFDDASTLTEALLSADALSQDDLHRFWTDHH